MRIATATVLLGVLIGVSACADYQGAWNNPSSAPNWAGQANPQLQPNELPRGLDNFGATPGGVGNSTNPGQ
jgi:hypothetical protein